MTRKKDEELLSEVYRNCQLALESISDILPEVENEKMREEMTKQHETYEKISARASVIAKDKGYEIKAPNGLKKAMMWSSIKMNTFANNSTSHIADMMVKGTVTGITALKTSLSETEQKDDEITTLATDLISAEEKFETTWKAYL